MGKNRLTITLSEDTLAKVDTTIDGTKIRNRSHAIETILTQHFSHSVDTAVILVGGKAEAIEHACHLVSGQPVVSHSIHLLQSHGISRIFILTDQESSQLEAICSAYDTVSILTQESALGTAGALRAAEKHFSGHSFVVIHGDVFTDINISDLLQYHQEQDVLATMCVQPTQNQKDFGKVIIHGSSITSFISQNKSEGVGLINTGVYVLHPKILELIPSEGSAMLETDVFPQLVANDQLAAFIFDGIWYDVSNRLPTT